MSITNKAVHDWAQHALDQSRHLPTVFQRLDAATDYLFAERNAGRCADHSLAAASHYMQCRSVIGMFSSFFMPEIAVFILVYNSWKLADLLIQKITGKKTVPAFGQCPPSPFDPLDVLWSYSGLVAGQTDFFLRFGSAELIVVPFPLPCPHPWDLLSIRT